MRTKSNKHLTREELTDYQTKDYIIYIQIETRLHLHKRIIVHKLHLHTISPAILLQIERGAIFNFGSERRGLSERGLNREWG